jgi:hypothetical protein
VAPWEWRTATLWTGAAVSGGRHGSRWELARRSASASAALQEGASSWLPGAQRGPGGKLGGGTRAAAWAADRAAGLSGGGSSSSSSGSSGPGEHAARFPSLPRFRQSVKLAATRCHCVALQQRRRWSAGPTSSRSRGSL